MKMVPQERVPYDPPPQRPGETDREYYLVWRNHFNLWLLQTIDDYFKAKGGRLPAPSSDIDDDDEREFFDRPVTYENQVFEIPPEFWERQLRETRDKGLPSKSSGKVEVSRSENGEVIQSSSSGSLQRPERDSSNIRRNIEHSEGPAAEQQEMFLSEIRPSVEQTPGRPQTENDMESSTPISSSNIEPTQTRKRRRLPAEESALGSSSKKQKTDKHPQLSTASNAAGCKRKRNAEEPLDEPSLISTPEQPTDKKRRLNTQRKIQSSRKRKRSSQEDDKGLQVSRVASEVPGSKRRRVSKTEVTDDASTAAGSRRILATASSLRITRARRRQLSGEDAQLLQLDQSGKPDVQEPKHAVHQPARELPATSRNGRRPKEAASMDHKNSRNPATTNYTKGGVKASIIAATKDTTSNKTSTKNNARTRSRNASGKSRGKGRLSST
ncbi:hypothetical protein M440DRAFT_1438024 [Trichoderma longibrachiatum ATCC 18648]|uniref:Uncharacterized protein n=1 Tax=Trichoderma longibrachiatum ATCC 18648 TaxID=983965 RepID=A0A2T4C7E7_TRILO|nr:hypothetical protein M440DRAFT_1438024 [Trichoderma longibrachiatum ATCC 18648]